MNTLTMLQVKGKSVSRVGRPSWSLVVFCCLICLLVATTVQAQRDGDRDDDDDDSGFDDNGYSSPQNHEAEGSNQNPSNYSPSSEEDLDDDDDVDETNVRPQVASDAQLAEAQNANYQQHQAGPYNAGPQRFYALPNSVLLANVDPAAIQYNGHQLRYRRSIEPEHNKLGAPIRGILAKAVNAARGLPLRRQKRHSKYIGPVYTYVKTDKHARFKWGVKHKVGKHHG